MNGDRQLKTPDVTPAQWGAIIAAIAALAAAFGLDISQDKQDAITNLVIVLAPIVILADAAIRHGRSRAMTVPPKGEVGDQATPLAAAPAAPRRRTRKT